MPNKEKQKEFDLDRYDHHLHSDESGDFSELELNDKGSLVTHEEHLTTIQLVADELITFMRKQLKVSLEIQGCSDYFISTKLLSTERKAKSLIQSKFTDKIWENEK